MPIVVDLPAPFGPRSPIGLADSDSQRDLADGLGPVAIRLRQAVEDDRVTRKPPRARRVDQLLKGARHADHRKPVLAGVGGSGVPASPLPI